jgi:hypothetical protein
LSTYEITRNLEKGGLYVPKFWTGLYTNRSPLYTPISALGIQLVQRQDAMWNGLNMQITPQFTVRRRYGFSKASSAAFSSSQVPLAFFSFEDLAGTVTPIVDTQTSVCNFSSTGLSTLFNKSTGAGQSSFNSVGNTMYWCDGKSAMKFVGPNLLLESGTFTSTWTISGPSVTGGAADPFGGTGAYTVQYAHTGFNDTISQTVTPNYTPVASNTFTLSIWMKTGTGSNTTNLVVLDQASNQLGGLLVTPTSTWTRYFVTFTALSASTSLVVYVTDDNSADGSGNKVLIYGAQLEANSVVTDYQATTTMPQGVYLMGIQAPTVAPALSTGAGALSPTVGYQYVYCWYNSETGTLSTASPASGNTGPLTSKNITVTVDGTADPQVSQIQIFRTDDGGAVYYFLASITNPGNTTANYTDSTVDSGLDDLLIAPVVFANNPPPAGMDLIFWYGGRLWGVSGNTLYFSAGPDATNGVGEECWPPGNNYTLPGSINAAAPTSSGLIVFTKDSAYVSTGSTAATFTVPQIWQANWGVQSQNCVAQDGDNVFIFTSRGQVYNFSANGVQEIGWPIATQLGGFTPASCYIALHRSGGQGSDADEGLFIADGSANVYRYSNVTSSWDPVIQPVGGIGAIASIELSDGAWHMLMGRASGSGYILKRDLTVFSDDGTAYACNVIFGSLTVSPPRTVAIVNSVIYQAPIVGTYPTVSVMLNEVTDTGSLPSKFVALPNPVTDPPQLALAQSTVWTKRHDLKAAQSPLPQFVQHLQVKITFATEAYANEIWGFGVS